MSVNKLLIFINCYKVKPLILGLEQPNQHQVMSGTILSVSGYLGV